VRLVRATGKPIAQVAWDLGVNEGTLGYLVNADKRRRALLFRGLVPGRPLRRVTGPCLRSQRARARH
jgi:hypothetical protein